MSLMLFALLGACLFYMARIVWDFKGREMAKRPVLEKLEQKIEALKVQIQAEMPLVEDAKMRVSTLRGLREDVMRQLEETRAELQTEQDYCKKLSLEVQKRVFRGTLARGRRLMLK